MKAMIGRSGTLSFPFAIVIGWPSVGAGRRRGIATVGLLIAVHPS
jgi:hypothetical protein